MTAMRLNAPDLDGMTQIAMRKQVGRMRQALLQKGGDENSAIGVLQKAVGNACLCRFRADGYLGAAGGGQGTHCGSTTSVDSCRCHIDSWPGFLCTPTSWLCCVRTLNSWSGWFGDNILVGWAMTSGYAVASAFIWSIGWATVNSKATSIWGQHTWRLVAMFMALLAPLCRQQRSYSRAPGCGMGYFAPGWGWLGTGSKPLLPMGMMIAWFAKSPTPAGCEVINAGVDCIGGRCTWLLHKPTVEVSSGSAAAVTTEWGKINGMQGSLKKHRKYRTFRAQQLS